ncbi:MAG: bifunctional folylpolyglutamate synthase/dihydrofolate synthase [Dehalococcoidia bacterium]
MDYRRAVDYILGFTDYETIPGIAYTAANYDLRRMEKLLLPLGNPHLGTKTVHIAGTKGKGSTAAMISQVLITAGYRTGLFTSPHLHTIRERVRVNNMPIAEEEFADIVTGLKPIVEKINSEAEFGNLTTFEILTAVVFDYFKKQGVDMQVLEAGLGGRLDATNVVQSDICVITSISLDHTAILGDTAAEIAGEKAGIIKPGCIVINAPQTEQSFTVKSDKTEYSLTTPLIGDFQLENATTAVAALEALSLRGVPVTRRAIEQGMREVNWPGRLQIIGEHPFLVVDGAHNAYSMKKLVETLQHYFTYSRCHVIFATSCDKDIGGMARELVALGGPITVTRSSHPRAASVSSIREQFSKTDIEIREAENLSEALGQIKDEAEDSDMILVTGSLFIVADTLDYIAS